uniref:SLTP001 n=1 Tax=Homo sapiens TaxID=9606 RepID=Q8TE09_HUMAN|nr:SLTP001 [Homo sapiens]
MAEKQLDYNLCRQHGHKDDHKGPKTEKRNTSSPLGAASPTLLSPLLCHPLMCQGIPFQASCKETVGSGKGELGIEGLRDLTLRRGCALIPCLLHYQCLKT